MTSLEPSIYLHVASAHDGCLFGGGGHRDHFEDQPGQGRSILGRLGV